jgi:hypothetical protein
LGARAKSIEVPVLPGHADHRHVQVAAAAHGMQGRENLFEREIAGRAEKDQCVGPH